MKMRNIRKVIIPSFALLIGASMAATISSTVAWFQYATRAQVAYVGALTHCSKMLKIKVGHDSTWSAWGNEFYQNDMANYISGNHLVPITTGAQEKDAAISHFYTQPDFALGGYDNWLPADTSYYAQFTILVKVTDVDGATTPALLENDVYINSLLIRDDSTNGTGADLSDAIRVHLAVTDATNTTRYFLFAKNVESTDVGGYLDLNNDGEFDKDLNSWGTQNCMYGEENAKQTSYKNTDSNLIVEDPDNATNPTSIGKTGLSNMTIVVTTWIEGWAKLDHGYDGNATGKDNTPVWDASYYINKKFNVGLRLGVKSHESDHQ